MEELLRLPGHRREKRHREPVHELRIPALERDAVGVRVDALDALERKAPQVEPFALLRIRLSQLLRVLGHADDVLGHEAVYRRVQARMGQPLDLVDEVVRDQLARRCGKLVRAFEARDPRGRQRVVAGDERRMGLIGDSRADADLVDGELAALDLPRLRHLQRRERDQLVGPLQVVVLERRLVHLLREPRLVLGVGLHRVEVLRPLDERRIQRVRSPLRSGIGIVPDFSAAGKRRDREQQESPQHAESIIGTIWASSQARRSSSPGC